MLVPRPTDAAIAIPAPGAGRGFWAGGPSAVAADDGFYLACRLRRPIGSGRGYAVAIAFSPDGVHFDDPIKVITSGEADTESLERPELVQLPDGRWRLYLSCATTGTKHWRVEVIDAASPAEFDVRTREVVLPGDPRKRAVKDPVIQRRNGLWHMWATIHPLADPDETDQMTTEYATSADGLDWTWQGTALSGRPGEWDSRGTRVAAVRFGPDQVVAYYDGRASAAENYEERTGIAVGADPAALVATSAPGPARTRSRRGQAAGCATSTWSTCRTGAPGSTTSWPSPTAPTPWSPSFGKYCPGAPPGEPARRPRLGSGRWRRILKAVLGLAFSGRAGADEAAGAVPGGQPVAEVLAEDGLEQLDVVAEGGQQRLPLLPAERLPLAGVALQEPLEPVGGRGRGRAGEQAADGVAGAHAERDRPVGQRALRVRGDVLPRDLGQQAGLDAEEAADPVEGGGRLVDQQPVPEHQHLLAREQRERVLELLAVPAEAW